MSPRSANSADHPPAAPPASTVASAGPPPWISGASAALTHGCWSGRSVAYQVQIPASAAVTAPVTRNAKGQSIHRISAAKTMYVAAIPRGAAAVIRPLGRALRPGGNHRLAASAQAG